MPFSVLKPPANLPVTLPSIKNHLRIEHDEDDDYLIHLAQAATIHVEADIRQQLVTRSLLQYADEISFNRQIVLEAYPVTQVLSVSVFGKDGTPELINPDTYRLRKGNRIYGVEFTVPISANRFVNGVEIVFVSGHGKAQADIPSNIIRAILVLVGHWYEHRGTQSAEIQMALLPVGFNALLNPMRRQRL